MRARQGASAVALSVVVLISMLAAGCASTPEPLVVTLVAEDILWNPEVIEAKTGQEIQITLRNDGALDHNFVSDELEVDILLSPGESKTVSFVMDQAGRWVFICDIPGHEEAGMVGEIIVSD